MTAVAIPPAESNLQSLIASDQSNTVCVIGSGPVGIRFVQELLNHHPNACIKLFGNEPFAPYNRVQLSSVLAGDIDRENISFHLPEKNQHPNFDYINCTIKSIDKVAHSITDALGTVYYYDKLILATGSRPFIPNIPGIQQQGVYTFRNLKDTDALYARLSSAKHIVIVGGGLLGIEAARALRRLNTRITLIHQGSRLMNRQLDDEAAGQLALKLQQSGIAIIVESGVRVVHGFNRVEGVTTRNGDRLDCDTVLFCTGVSCNTQLLLMPVLKQHKVLL
ncbi:NAD(P)/FAD-dependent oxidoreductase [Oceanicoccus sp. KOV_DT_Chl]|uniref:NAD(P)/FAD-dependent oxidoreductase n=1 Tax=Oceanicoccus sp. KOV_DT_Chl TaxID=1904639 RepID=UPI000C7B1A36|nr:FAD-dependent oxidoreductase [Oceanicoccus sp. KOV_DT_Chl]